jgi:twitching motility protein PilU
MNIEELLKLMVEKAASDIYITVDSTPAYRVEGKTVPIPGEALKPEDTENKSIFKIRE